MPPPVTIDSHISFDADAVFRELDGEAVVLSLRTGLYFGLNEVGTRVWQLIEQHRDLRQVFDALRAEFEVGDDRLLRDLVALVEQLRDKGLVHVESVGE